MNYKLVLSGIFSLVILLISGTTSHAQELLTLEDAVKIALERNYDIKLVSNDLRIDKNNVTWGNAGFLPRLDATLSTNNTLLNSTQTLSNGTTQERNGARNSNRVYGVGLNWTIFDGFGMFARYDQLEEFQKLGEKELQQTVLTRVSDVMNTYYDLVNQQQQLRAYDTAVRISAQRVELAQNRFTIGKASRLEVLNAEVDFNTDTTNLIRQNQFYNNTQIALNELLARDVNIRFIVSDSILIDDKLTYAQLAELVQLQNPTLQAAFINKRIAELDLKQVKSDRYPEISLNSGYNFNQSQSALGFATQSSGRGLNYGVTASVNIFNGFNQRRLEKNAGILIENAQLQLEQTNLNLQSQLSTAFQTYATALALVKLEEKNQAIAKRNLEITVDKFKLGSIRPIEFREAQLNYVNSNVRYSNSQYAAKLAEIALKEIAGNVSL